LSGQIDDDLPSVHHIAGFIRDALRDGLSVWTVVNVFKPWIDRGTPKHDVRKALLAEYERGLEQLL
jgi:hypothetical protein